MPPYVADIAQWLDDDDTVHPCNGEESYKGFEIMMAICRSVIQRGQIALPLPDGPPELDELCQVLPDTPILVSAECHRDQYSV